MNKETTTSIALLSLLILSTITVSGCLDLGQEKDGAQDIKYPDSEEVNIPEEVSDELRNELIQDSSLSAYSSEDSPQEIRNWFNEEMDSKNWEKVFEEYNTIAWEKNERYLAISILSQEKANELFELNKTVIIHIEG